MHTLASARRTCMASASAVEWTATLSIPISRHARITRSAISPRFATSTLSNMATAGPRLFDDQKKLAILNGIAVGHQELGDPAAARRANGIHDLHRFDDKECLTLAHITPERDEWLRAWLGRQVDGADHRRLNGSRMLL